MAKEKKTEPKGEEKIIPCTLKELPPELALKAAETAVKINPNNAPPLQTLKAAMPDVDFSPLALSVLTTKYWGSGGVRLTVAFLDNPAADLRARILSHMNAWGAFSNVQFVESNVSPQVRITRKAGDGYWSYLGTDILNVPTNQATMNLASFTMNTSEATFRRVVRHETGHTLGFPHEHLRAEIINGIDREKAIASFMASQGWSREKVISNVLTPLSQSALISTANADPNSIMCYSLPGNIMKNGIGIPGGNDIDAQDAQFAGMVYPRTSGMWSTYYTLRGNGTVRLNVTNPKIRSNTSVYASISEYSTNPRQTRFVGAAKMRVYNISPYDGGCFIWADISWASPLNTVIDIVANG